jgi:hypothetical protein
MIDSALSLIEKYEDLQSQLFNSSSMAHEDYARVSKEMS